MSPTELFTGVVALLMVAVTGLVPVFVAAGQHIDAQIAAALNPTQDPAPQSAHND